MNKRYVPGINGIVKQNVTHCVIGVTILNVFVAIGEVSSRVRPERTLHFYKEQTRVSRIVTKYLGDKNFKFLSSSICFVFITRVYPAASK